jgi:hypothetical protein
MAAPDPQILVWNKSSRSDDSGCVEVALTAALVLVRDSKNLSGPHLTFSYDEWRTFLSSVRNIELGVAQFSHSDDVT